MEADGEAQRPRVGTRGLEPASPEKTAPSPREETRAGLRLSDDGAVPRSEAQAQQQNPHIQPGRLGGRESQAEAKLCSHTHRPCPPPLGSSPDSQSHRPWAQRPGGRTRTQCFLSSERFCDMKSRGPPAGDKKTAELRGSQTHTHGCAAKLGDRLLAVSGLWWWAEGWGV